MEKAKQAIKEFTGRAGQHDTTVHETVSPHVQHETVKPHQHENVTTAVDKEIHQDHYHTTVQPVHDREVLPEQHTHKLGEVQHRTFDNRDHEGTKRSVTTEAAKFADQRVVHDTTHSQKVQPTVGGEHHHHHIHETIQPIVQKETVQPHVVHTTVPIHETHHNPAQHHTTSHLPAVSLQEFKGRGGVLGGREERYDAFEGEPKNIGNFAQGTKGSGEGLIHKKHDSHHSGAGLATGAAAGTAAERELSGRDHTGHHHGTTGQHHTGAELGAAGAGVAAERELAGKHHNGHHSGTGLGATGAAAGAGVAAERELSGKDHHTGAHHYNTAGTSGLTGNNTTGTGLGSNERGFTGNNNTTGLTGNNTTGLAGNNTTGTGLGNNERGFTGNNNTTGLTGNNTTTTGNSLGSNRTGGTLGSGATDTDRTTGTTTGTTTTGTTGTRGGEQLDSTRDASERTSGGPLPTKRDSAHETHSSRVGGGGVGVGNTKGVSQPGGHLGREAKQGVVGTGVPGFGTHEKSVQGAGPSVGAPSLKDTLDPRVDADGDGQRGVGK